MLTKTADVWIEIHAVAPFVHDWFQKWIPITIRKILLPFFWIIQISKVTTVRRISKPIFCKVWFCNVLLRTHMSVICHKRIPPAVYCSESVHNYSMICRVPLFGSKQYRLLDTNLPHSSQTICDRRISTYQYEVGPSPVNFNCSPYRNKKKSRSERRRYEARKRLLASSPQFGTSQHGKR